MRRAGKAELSLALMDARNHTLRWSHAFEAATSLRPDGTPGLPRAAGPAFDPHDWLLGHIGWFQEQVVARNVQRHRGRLADARAPRLASIDPGADALYDPSLAPAHRRGSFTRPPIGSVRQYLIDTLEVTLELLERSDGHDDALHFFRLALFHEDLCSESLAVLAQATGFDAGLLAPAAGFLPREALVFPATTWRLGSDDAGFTFDRERPAHDVAVPEFQIDAQPVTWAQFCEFVEDGGYDDPQWWSDEGWRFLQASGRRCPRYVDQMRQGVLVHRFGQLMRVPLNQPAMHVTWHEADAWCRWAGRRLPTEVEWELAAATGTSRGLRWGGVWEWVAGRYRPYPDAVISAWGDGRLPAETAHDHEPQRVLRGASFATRTRVRNAKHRHPQLGDRDHLFTGFRSCAL